MAQGFQFVCDHCRVAVKAWDDGNPYYFDKRGRKRYAYHPDPQRDRCVGVDLPHLCLSCGAKFMVDSRSPLKQCPKCSSDSITDQYHLAGKDCPYCKTGMFGRDPEFLGIS